MKLKRKPGCSQERRVDHGAAFAAIRAGQRPAVTRPKGPRLLTIVDIEKVFSRQDEP